MQADQPVTPGPCDTALPVAVPLPELLYVQGEVCERIPAIPSLSEQVLAYATVLDKLAEGYSTVLGNATRLAWQIEDPDARTAALHRLHAIPR